MRNGWLLRVRWWLTTLLWLVAGIYLCYLILTVPLPLPGT
jgi:hypothetical protein